MSYRKVLEAKQVTARQVSKLAQETDITNRCTGCFQMILERDINHPCPEWPFRSLA